MQVGVLRGGGGDVGRGGGDQQRLLVTRGLAPDFVIVLSFNVKSVLLNGVGYMEGLIALRHMIQSNGYFESVVAGVESWEVILGKRDQPPFDKCWIDAFNAVQGLNYQDPDDEAAISALREFAFKQTYRVTRIPK
ncbi:hypothetical protein [Pseudomonas sp. PGPR81]|nr:hypothetical protein [Pseudomonas sp. M5]